MYSISINSNLGFFDFWNIWGVSNKDMIVNFFQNNIIQKFIYNFFFWSFFWKINIWSWHFLKLKRDKPKYYFIFYRYYTIKDERINFYNKYLYSQIRLKNNVFMLKIYNYSKWLVIFYFIYDEKKKTLCFRSDSKKKTSIWFMKNYYLNLIRYSKYVLTYQLKLFKVFMHSENLFLFLYAILFIYLLNSKHNSFQLLLNAEMLWITLYILALQFSFLINDLNILSFLFFFLVFSAIEFSLGYLFILITSAIFNNSNFKSNKFNNFLLNCEYNKFIDFFKLYWFN